MFFNTRGRAVATGRAGYRWALSKRLSAQPPWEDFGDTATAWYPRLRDGHVKEIHKETKEGPFDLIASYVTSRAHGITLVVATASSLTHDYHAAPLWSTMRMNSR